MILKDLAELWFSSMAPKVKESTMVKYHNIWNCYISPELENLYVGEITHAVLESFCSRLLASGGHRHNGLSPKTVADTLTLLKNMLHFSKNIGCHPAADGSSVNIRQRRNDFLHKSRMFIFTLIIHRPIFFTVLIIRISQFIQFRTNQT